MIAVLHLGHNLVPRTSGNLQLGQKSAIAANERMATDPPIKSDTAHTQL